LCQSLPNDHMYSTSGYSTEGTLEHTIRIPNYYKPYAQEIRRVMATPRNNWTSIQSDLTFLKVCLLPCLYSLATKLGDHQLVAIVYCGQLQVVRSI